MDIHQRRRLLRTEANPAPRSDYVATLGGRLVAPAAATLELRYVPDKLILGPEALAAYLHALGGIRWDSVEAVAAAILDDVNNEVVPRWVLVHLVAAAEDGTVCAHSVLLEDRQPRWDNPSLLARLGTF